MNTNLRFAHRRAPRFPHRQRGQVVVLFILGIIGLLMMVLMVLNTGAFLDDKIRARNAADAAVIGQANWTARTMNVISLNNVAASQSFAITVLADVFDGVLVEGLEKALARLEDYQLRLAACEDEDCRKTLQRSIDRLNERVIAPMEELQAEQPQEAIDRFGDIASRLDTMNQQLVTDFPLFTGQVQQSLAQPNGLRVEDVLFYPAVAGVSTSPLPVQAVTVEDAASLLCSAGGFGGNDQSQNGPINGPGFLRRDNIEVAINTPISDLEGEHATAVDADFYQDLEHAWKTRCGRQILPNGNRLTLFRPLNNGKATNRRWSMMAFTRIRKDTAAIWPGDFDEPIQAVFGLAGAAVHNRISYDLYTQGWLAALSPVQLLEATQRTSIIAALEPFQRGQDYRDHQALVQVLNELYTDEFSLLHGQ